MTLVELASYLGGGLFLFSWVLQAYQSKQRGEPVVTLSFFVVRLAGSMLLLVEAIRVESIGLIAVIGGTMAILVYNIALLLRDKRRGRCGRADVPPL